MNTKSLFLLSTAVVLAAVAAPALVGNSASVIRQASPTSVRIADLPAVVVHPAAEDDAWYQAHKIVDLATVTVYPEPGDLALFVADAARTASCLC